MPCCGKLLVGSLIYDFKTNPMAILDSQGRLFGRISLLDIGAGLIILLAIAGIFLFPGSSGSVAQLGATMQPVEVDVMFRGLTVRNPQDLVDDMTESGKTNIIIRNQPSGTVDIAAVEVLPRTVAVPQPDGSVVAMPDPRPELNYTTDMLVTLAGNAEVTGDGIVMGNSKIKIGTPLEIEGKAYRINTTVVGVRVPGEE